jgi:hypothetical protein
VPVTDTALTLHALNFPDSRPEIIKKLPLNLLVYARTNEKITRTLGSYINLPLKRPSANTREDNVDRVDKASHASNR